MRVRGSERARARSWSEVGGRRSEVGIARAKSKEEYKLVRRVSSATRTSNIHERNGSRDRNGD